MPKTKEVKTVEVEVEVDETEATELATVDTGVSISDSPRWEEAAQDILIGRYNIRGKSSGYDAGEFGDIVLKQESVVVKDGHPAEAIVVSALQMWREKTDYGSGQRGRIAKTREEMLELVEENRALGDRGLKVIPFADLTILIKESEGCDEEGFEVPIGEDRWALGKLDVSGKGYEHTYLALKFFEKVNPGVSLVKQTWELVSKQQQWDQKVWWIPTLKPSKTETSQEVVDWVENFKKG